MSPIADDNQQKDARKGSKGNDEIVGAIIEIMKRCDKISSKSTNDRSDATRRK